MSLFGILTGMADGFASVITLLDIANNSTYTNIRNIYVDVLTTVTIYGNNLTTASLTFDNGTLKILTKTDTNILIQIRASHIGKSKLSIDNGIYLIDIYLTAMALPLGITSNVSLGIIAPAISCIEQIY